MNNVMSKVFLWLFLGLALTFGVGYYVSTNSTMLYNILDNHEYVFNTGGMHNKGDIFPEYKKAKASAR